MKRYQIFVSSTYKDLKEERLSVIQTILSMDHIPSGMEMFSSNSEEQFEAIKKVIDLCDFYLLIIANRYGTVSKTTGLSYTEMEFDYALSKNIPILAFVIDEKLQHPSENKEKLGAFIEKVSSGRIVSFWSNAGDLSTKVAVSLGKEISRNKATGWVKGDELELNIEEIAKLKKENKQLEENVKDLQTKLSSFIETDQDLLFDEDNIEVTCQYRYGSNITKRSINLGKVFKYVSIQMIDVSIKETLLIDYIKQSIDVYEINISDAKRICNQFLVLKLMSTRYSEGKGLYYQLTEKGTVLRNKLNLYTKSKQE